jgi:hypothetical protein
MELEITINGLSVALRVRTTEKITLSWLSARIIPVIHDRSIPNAILLSFSGTLSGIVQSIPTAVTGGLSIYLFGVIGMQGIA